MYKIINKQILANDVRRLDIYCPDVVMKIQTGQYVSVCPTEGDEHIPLTVVEVDLKRKSIALIFKEVGETTKKLSTLSINEPIYAVLGPLGKPARIMKYGTVVCLASGIASAQLLPVCRALRQAGNKVIGIIGAKTKRALVAESQMRLACDRIFVMTEDGSFERKGKATDMLEKLISEKDVDLVYTIGSVDMMKRVSVLCKSNKISLRVQLNPVMVDCMGMCGSCRVKVGGKVVLSCVEGPEFDGHKVDYDYYRIRTQAYEESDEWRNQRLQSSRKKNESKTFSKFLSGLLKK